MSQFDNKLARCWELELEQLDSGEQLREGTFKVISGLRFREFRRYGTISIIRTMHHGLCIGEYFEEETGACVGISFDADVEGVCIPDSYDDLVRQGSFPRMGRIQTSREDGSRLMKRPEPQ
jgi:hypothetical protein